MPRWITVAPTDTALTFGSTLHVRRNVSGRAVFDRCFPGEARCARTEQPCCPTGMLRAPGAAVSMRTNAAGIRAQLEYADCRTTCAGNYPMCYKPLRQCPDSNGTQRGCSTRRSEAFCIKHRITKCGGVCLNHCQPRLYIDGIRHELPSPSARDRYDGLETLELVASDQPGERKIELMMPSGGDVRFASMQLIAGAQPLTVSRAPPARFTYVAYGDSITAGGCADTPYPEFIGRMNGWNVLNLGFDGMKLIPAHGAALGRIAAPLDLISVLIGTNNHGECDLRTPFGHFLDGLRRHNPTSHVVVVTLLTRNDEGTSNATGHNNRCKTVEQHREQLRAAVWPRQATDSRLHLVEGRSLLSVNQLVDGLHPRDREAMHEIARKLNGEFHRLGIANRFRCYAQQHRDLRRAHCEGGDLAKCDFPALIAHWEGAGRKEGRKLDCSPPAVL